METFARNGLMDSQIMFMHRNNMCAFKQKENVAFK